MPENAEEQREYFTTSELATRWRVTTRTVTNWCNAGEFPNALRLWRGWRIPKADVIAFEKRNKLNR